MLIMRKCADYVIIILTGHGVSGDRHTCSPSSQGTVCCVCTQEFIVIFFYLLLLRHR